MTPFLDLFLDAAKGGKSREIPVRDDDKGLS